MKNNKQYEAPEALVVRLDAVDVITTSGPMFEDGNVMDDGWVGV